MGILRLFTWYLRRVDTALSLTRSRHVNERRRVQVPPGRFAVKDGSFGSDVARS
jgi:hypothetical protein